jgi:hypothetical protein
VVHVGYLTQMFLFGREFRFTHPHIQAEVDNVCEVVCEAHITYIVGLGCVDLIRLFRLTHPHIQAEVDNVCEVHIHLSD